ncbi:Oidioi.mRNA.OKI2018_I69.chr2.g7397.t1.cds [Oikopleura dioica]|uniref:Oidioi.mRNA.OKI2018_I69.chr2.g7397.t1.cds n=1 Tax=Oikopleura dioica TaxID=34765 RepID=A0ABN7TCJ3_OIKDI|nr:Oidioi.mRNA.OKI2018_I69.chr2.g7397.t1.cds [Oikopleura dioica]
MKDIDKQIYVSKKYVTSSGLIGKCFSCGGAPKSTAAINGHRYCKKCVIKKFPTQKDPKYDETDAKFKCYASNIDRGCGAEELTYREFYVGSCCENAANSTRPKMRYERAAVVNEIYEETRKEEGLAEERNTNAAKKVEEAEKALEEAKLEKENAYEELQKIKEWRRKVQKRSLVLTKNAMKEDNNLEDSTDESDKNLVKDEPDDKLKCKVCFEIFCDEHPEALVIPCGHRACFNCLSSLPQKTCPSCRAEFTEDKIFKIY